MRVVLGLTPEAAATGHVAADLAAAIAERAWSVVGGRWNCRAVFAQGVMRETLVYQFDTIKAERSCLRLRKMATR